MNITLCVDEAIVMRMRKIAIDKNTTLDAMVREYLISVVESHAEGRKEQADGIHRTPRA
jgi:hypothetical protein